MTELVRTVRSGSVGLDLALGGGPRFVRKAHLGDRETATLLIRGGPGTGKSVLAQDLALRLAGQLGGDVLYVCVEVLPSEVQAQRMGFEGYDPARVIDLSREGDRDPNAKEPHLVLGMRETEVGADGVPDIGGTLLALTRIAIGRGFKPKVVVVDALSDGYGLGGKAPRELVDGVCKIAIEQGWGLILIEGVADESVSSWAFAVDTVLSLRLAPAKDGAQARRELIVTKHRFASCEPGPHRLQIEANRVRVIPPFSAYRNAVRDLVLPPPSAGRSLSVPVVGTPPGWEVFRVPDGEGRALVVSGEAENEPREISRLIGRAKDDGDSPTGQLIAFVLAERNDTPSSPVGGELVIGTLHQFVGGEEWLEDVLTQLAARRGEIARVRVGPTQRLDVYENAADLQRAISLLVDVLRRRGLVVVLFGTTESLQKSLRTAILSGMWSVTLTDATSHETRVKVSVGPKPAVEFFPALTSSGLA